MTARERDPQGVSGPAADLTRIEAIRHHVEVARREVYGLCDGSRKWRMCVPVQDDDSDRVFMALMDDVAWLLARLAPATPSGAATAGDAGEETDAMRGHAITPEERRGMRALVKAAMYTIQPERFWADWLRCLDALDAADALAVELDEAKEWARQRSDDRRLFAHHAALAAYRAIVAPASAERSGAAPEICDGPAATCCCGRAHREGPATAAGAGEDSGGAPVGNEDGTARLCRALYGRDAKPGDYLGGSNARMLHDAADRLPAPPAAGPLESWRLEGNAGEPPNPERPTDGGAGHE